MYILPLTYLWIKYISTTIDNAANMLKSVRILTYEDWLWHFRRKWKKIWNRQLKCFRGLILILLIHYKLILLKM